MAINMHGRHLSNNKTYDIQAQNAFEVIISGLGQDITLSVSRCALPEISIDVVELPYFNGTVKVAGKVSHEAGSIDVRDAIGADVEKQLLAWFTKTYDMQTGKIGWISDYKKDITINQYSSDGTICRPWVLHGAWISTFSPGELDHSSADKKIIALTIQYDYAERR